MANLINGVDGFGSQGLTLTEVRLRDDKGVDVQACACGDSLVLKVVARANGHVKRPNLGFALIALSGNLLYSEGVLNHGVMLADLAPGETCEAVFKIEMALSPGSYGLTVIAADNEKAGSGDSGVHHDTRERIARIEVGPSAASSEFDGVGRLPVTAGYRFV